jgi:hypothetical protein
MCPWRSRAFVPELIRTSLSSDEFLFFALAYTHPPPYIAHRHETAGAMEGPRG